MATLSLPQRSSLNFFFFLNFITEIVCTCTPRLTWVLLCYFGSQLRPFSMLVFHTLHEKLLQLLLIGVIMLLSCANMLIVRDQWTIIASSAYLFIKIFFLFLFLLLSLSSSSLLLLLTSILLSKSNCATKPFHWAKQTSA